MAPLLKSLYCLMGTKPVFGKGYGASQHVNVDLLADMHRHREGRDRQQPGAIAGGPDMPGDAHQGGRPARAAPCLGPPRLTATGSQHGSNQSHDPGGG
jgi:hypothetical protein